MSHRPGRRRTDGGDERLVDAVGDGVYALDADGQFIEVNEAVVGLTGYDPETIYESGPWLWHDEADIYRLEDATRRLLRAETEADEQTQRQRAPVERVQATLETAAGERLAVEVTLRLLPMANGEYHGHTGVVRQVDDRTRGEANAESVELPDHGETIVQAMPDEVYTVDEEGYFTSVLPAAGSTITTAGYEAETLVGEHVSHVLDEEDVEYGTARVNELLDDPETDRASFELEVVTADGDRVPHENHVAPIPTDDEGFQGIVGVLRDVSDRKAREAALERQNERLQEFADVVSHDLRNPLNVAMANLELLREDYDDERLDRLVSAHDRMGTIIEDVMALAREGAAVEDAESVSLRDVGRYAWSSVETERATIGLTGDLVLEADVGRLGRLLENLFRNAIEHGGEEVTVTLGRVAAGGDRDPHGFYVEDDGPGIPPADRGDIFESGYSNAADGTGLGLAIVRRIADAHGWNVAVSEGADGGARFDFTGITAV